jgi:hypothetical protein
MVPQRRILGLVAVTVPTLGWFAMGPREVSTQAAANPELDPAARKKAAKETEDSSPKYIHPEHRDDELQAPFGQLHKKKRVDGPPDDRNHQSLNDRQRVQKHEG